MSSLLTWVCGCRSGWTWSPVELQSQGACRDSSPGKPLANGVDFNRSSDSSSGKTDLCLSYLQVFRFNWTKPNFNSSSLFQNVQTRCTEQLRAAEQELSGRQEEVKRSLTAVQDQTAENRTVLDQQQAELQDHMETCQQLVHGFLQEELQQDVPTGTQFNLPVPFCFYLLGSGFYTLLCCCLQVRHLSGESLCIRGSWWSCRAAVSCWRAWGGSRRSCRPPWRRRSWTRRRKRTNTVRSTTYVHFPFIFLLEEDSDLCLLPWYSSSSGCLLLIR